MFINILINSDYDEFSLLFLMFLGKVIKGGVWEFERLI